MKPLPPNADLIVIGGGVIGQSVAWHYARAGYGRVLLLERGMPAAQASSQAAALLTRLRESAELMAFTRRTDAAIDELEAELGEPLDRRRSGQLHVAASETAADRLQQLASLAARTGEPWEWLGASTTQRLAPWLAADAIRQALLLPAESWIDPYRLAMAYGRAARGHGARLQPGVEVTALRVERGRVVGVETTRGAVAAGCVVDASGVWAGLLAGPYGGSLPFAAVRSQYWITASAAPKFPLTMPVVLLPDLGLYARPELGALLFGVRESRSAVFDARTLPHDIEGFDTGDGWQALAGIAPALARLSPTLIEVGIRHHVSGLSTYTPDGRYVLGALPGLDGLLVASGCCGSGVAASGGIGQALAELAAGRTPFVDLAAFAPARFGSIDRFSPDWLSRCGAARAGKRGG